jgi:hypothetical protein
MTTLGAWIAYNKTRSKPKRASALYFISDSRITWGSSRRRWDAGRKIFTPSEEPHIFGYCGDVVFPSLVLAQLTSAIDQKILFPSDADAETRHAIILNSVKTSLGRRHDTPDANFWILHAMRKTAWPNPSFALWTIQYQSKGHLLQSVEVPIGQKTDVLICLGSGRSSVNAYARKWRESDVGGTSRSIFSAFYDAMQSGDDPLSGGSPQIAALYSTREPQIIGFLNEQTPYLHGLEIMPGEILSRIEWVDSVFQRINPTTMKVVSGARRFARPRGL